MALRIEASIERATRRAAALVRVVGLGALMGAAPAAMTAPGDLDLSFGVDGITGVASLPNEISRALVVQSDGKIVAAGRIGNHFGLSRHNADGSIDTTFGVGGYVTTVIGDYSTIVALLRQGDGRIVAAGTRRSDAGGTASYAAALARYDASGTLDPSFGNAGIVIAALSYPRFDLRGAAFDLTGSIVLTGAIGLLEGETRFPSPQLVPYPAWTLRLLPDGATDPTYLPASIPGLAYFGGSAFWWADSVTVDGQGRILLAGRRDAGNPLIFSPLSDFVAIRLLPSGALDSSFFSEGAFQWPPLTFGNGFTAVATRPGIGGGMAAAAMVNYSSTPSVQFGALWSERNSSLAPFVMDRPFGPTPGAANAVAVQPDGASLFGGHVEFAGVQHIALFRLRSDGLADPAFGSNGTVITAYGESASIRALALQPDGAIVALASPGLLLRYHGDSIACAAFLDVPSQDPFCGNLAWLRNRGVTQGCKAEWYCPFGEDVRLSMAAFVARVGGVLTRSASTSESTTGSVDLDTQPVLCQTDAVATASYARRAHVDGLFRSISAAGVNVALTVVASEDNGLNWIPATITPSIATSPAARWSNLRTRSEVEMAAGKALRFGLRVERTATPAAIDLDESTCQVRVAVGP